MLGFFLMRKSTLAFAIAIATVLSAHASDSVRSKEYKSAIEDYVTLHVGFKHPEYARLFFSFSEPARVFFGNKRQQRLAVRCDYGAALKNGDILLMIVSRAYLIDEGFVYEVSPTDRIEWVDGVPKEDKGQPNQLSDPTSPFVTPPAFSEGALSVAADH
jgi:hypothetical protein